MWRLCAAGLVLAVVTGCSSGVPAPRHSSGTPPPVPSSAPVSGNPQAQARLAYLGMWQAFVAASRTADYQSGSLARYAAGGALSVLTHGLYQNYQDGIVTRGQPDFDPAVTIVTGSGGSPVQADVSDCADSSRWLDYKAGKPVAGQPQGRRRIMAQLELFDGVWKVTYLNVGKEGTC